MLYTVAKLAALLSGVAMAADHSVPHSDETEHIKKEIEPHRFDSLLCSDVFRVITSFCDTCSISSIRLTNWNMYRSFNRVFLKDWQKWMKAPLTDDWKIDQFEQGLIECDSIDQVKESIVFSRSIPVCFTPRFCGKLILSRQMVDHEYSDSESTFELQPYCKMPMDPINIKFQINRDPNSFANDQLIGRLERKPALMNIRTGKVIELPSCKSARFLNDRTIVLFHGDKFQFYDLFDGEGDLFGEDEFPVNRYAQWSVTQTDSTARAIVCNDSPRGITYFTLDNDQGRWMKKTIKYEKSKESETFFKNFLSPDGSILIVIEIFKDYSLVNIVDAHTESIRHTVVLPYDNFRELKIGRNGAYFKIGLDTALLMDLNTAQLGLLAEQQPGHFFCWMSESRFWLYRKDQSGNSMTHIRSLDHPFTDLITNHFDLPLAAELIYTETRQFLKLTEVNDRNSN